MLQVPVPLAGQHCTGPQAGLNPIQVCCELDEVSRRSRFIQQLPSGWVEIAEGFSLQPICESSQQQMSGQARGRLPPKHRAPSGSERIDIETTQMRDLNVDRLAIRRCRTNRHARHGLKPFGGLTGRF